jgi:hypothetical protein
MPSMKEVLAAKLTTKEQFDDALASVDSRNRRQVGRFEKRDEQKRLLVERKDYYGVDGYFANDSEVEYGNEAYYNWPNGDGTIAFPPSRWWLLRERLRLRYGNYDLTRTLKNVDARFPELAVHCSAKADDPAIVAYTPNPEAGERDAQVQISLGKLLRKLYPHVDDGMIAKAEAEHRAEMSDEIEFITGAENFENAYLNAPSACMSKSRGSYGLTDYHPTHVYDAPGVALAVTRNADGEINARSFVWVNPADESDKRYIRIYGDEMLKRRLERRGFRCAGWEGVRLRRLVLSEHNGYVTVVMPYIDAPGHDSSGAKCGRRALLDGDALLMVSADTAVKVQRKIGMTVPGCTSTSGKVAIPLTATLDALNEVCPITGVTFDSDEGKQWVWRDETALKAHPTARERLVSEGWMDANVYAPNLGTIHKMLVAPGSATFAHGGNRWLDQDYTRRWNSYLKLDPKYYTEGWVQASSSLVEVEGSDGLRWRAEDAVSAITMVNGAATLTHVHRSTMGGLAEWQAVHRMNAKTPLYAAKDVPVVLTRSKRRVVKGVHEVHELYDGTVDFTRNVTEVRWFNAMFFVPKGETIESIPLDRRVEGVVGDLKQRARYAVSRYLITDEGERPDVDSFRLYCVNQFASRVGHAVGSLSAYTGQPDGTVAAMNLVGYNSDPSNRRARWANAVETAPAVVALMDPTTVVGFHYDTADSILCRAKTALAFDAWMNEEIAKVLPAPIAAPTPEVAQALSDVATSRAAAAPAPRYVVAA